METETHSPVTSGDILFVSRNSWPNEEKPYILLYIPTDDLPMSNFDFTDMHSVPIRDLRPKKGKLSLDREGFIIADFQSSLAYKDYYDEKLLKSIFVEELRPFLLNLLDAQALYVHECVLRKRDSQPGEEKGLGRPVQDAHTDYTITYVHRLIKQLAEESADQIRARRFQMINVWKPLRGPLRDWPLALCDYSSVEKADLVEVDEVHREDILESHGLHYNAGQKWYHLSDQTPEEILIFKSADSHVKGEVPHAAFEDRRYQNEEPRESIELRILVVY